MGRSGRDPLHTLGGRIAEIVARSLSSPFRGKPRGWRLEYEVGVDTPPILRVEAESSRVTVECGGGDRIVVSGRAPGQEGVSVEEAVEDGRRIVVVRVEDSEARIAGPVKALGVVADSSHVRIDCRSAPLAYLSLRLDSTRLRGVVSLREGGGVYANLDSSTVRLSVVPMEGREYWLETVADSSILHVTFNGGARYELVEKMLDDSTLKASGKGGVRVRVWLRADSSIVLLS